MSTRICRISGESSTTKTRIGFIRRLQEGSGGVRDRGGDPPRGEGAPPRRVPGDRAPRNRRGPADPLRPRGRRARPPRGRRPSSPAQGRWWQAIAPTSGSGRFQRRASSPPTAPWSKPIVRRSSSGLRTTSSVRVAQGESATLPRSCRRPAVKAASASSPARSAIARAATAAARGMGHERSGREPVGGERPLKPGVGAREEAQVANALHPEQHDGVGHRRDLARVPVVGRVREAEDPHGEGGGRSRRDRPPKPPWRRDVPLPGGWPGPPSATRAARACGRRARPTSSVGVTAAVRRISPPPSAASGSGREVAQRPLPLL